MIILQGNTRSLIANGQEFKGFIKKCKKKPEIICIQVMIVSAEIERRVMEEDVQHL